MGQHEVANGQPPKQSIIMIADVDFRGWPELRESEPENSAGPI